jgi:hypothetical protein
VETSEQEAYEELKKFLSDKSWRLSHLYYIKDKQGRVVKFKPNQTQLQYRAHQHNRNIILKARQLGFTTDACIDALDDCLFNPHFNAGIIADTLDNAKSIFSEKVKFAYDHLPEMLKQARPAATDREGELKFNNGSSVSVSTSFRGGTLRRLHISEFGKICAKYPQKAREIITGAFEAVPLDGRIDVESTAEGMEGEFYELCQKAMAHARELTPLDFKFHFFPWHENQDYQLEAVVEIAPKLSEYFDYLEREQGIKTTQQQRAWYALKQEQLKGDMKREYPSYPQEAFLSSGRPVFEVEQVAADLKRAQGIEVRRGDVVDGQFTEHKHGAYKLFKTPQEGKRYAIGADVAEGLEGGDFSTMTALNKDFEQVMSFCGHLHPDLFGKEMLSAGELFNKALLAPEVNNHGLTTLTHITNKSYPYVYMRQVYDERSKEYTPKAGWQTSVKTKTLMLDEFVAAYRDRSVQINDIGLLQEMLTLSIGADGSVNLNGKDRVVSMCIALQALKQVTEVAMPAYDSTVDRKKFTKMSDYLKHSEDADESYFD